MLIVALVPACGDTSELRGSGYAGSAQDGAPEEGEASPSADAAGSTNEGGTGGGEAGPTTSGLPPQAIAGTSLGTCGLDSMGRIHCWGLSPKSWTIPQGTFASLHGSVEAVCALRSDATAACFAQPLGIVDLSFVPQQRAFAQLALGLGAACWTDETGSPSCAWGTPPYALPAPNGERFRRISVGVQFACGIRQDNGGILCWGSPGSVEACSFAPQAGQLDAPSGSFVEIASGTYSSCAVRDDGSVACWGAGKSTDDPNVMFCGGPLNFGQSKPPPGSFRSVAVGSNHACGVHTNGMVECWGAGSSDDCVAGSSSCRQSRPPTIVFDQVTVGAAHSCGMKSDRKVVCWGYGDGADGRTNPPQEFQ
jgi:hypothetical protein